MGASRSGRTSPGPTGTHRTEIRGTSAETLTQGIITARFGHFPRNCGSNLHATPPLRPKLTQAGTIGDRLYLNELERETGASIIRGNRRGVKVDVLQRDRENGQRRASLHDFHSFRVTWITLALAAGVPLELVQRVTGHRTVAVVLKHYFRPGREDFKQVLFKAMPNMLGATALAPAKVNMRRIIERMTHRTLKKDRVRLLGLLASI